MNALQWRESLDDALAFIESAHARELQRAHTLRAESHPAQLAAGAPRAGGGGAMSQHAHDARSLLEAGVPRVGGGGATSRRAHDARLLLASAANAPRVEGSGATLQRANYAGPLLQAAQQHHLPLQQAAHQHHMPPQQALGLPMPLPQQSISIPLLFQQPPPHFQHISHLRFQLERLQQQQQIWQQQVAGI